MTGKQAQDKARRILQRLRDYPLEKDSRHFNEDVEFLIRELLVPEIKDPHVFPYIVKGFKDSAAEGMKFESRRDPTEAEQTADRYRSEGFIAYVFEVRPLKE